MNQNLQSEEPTTYKKSWKQRWLQAITLMVTSFVSIYFSIKSWSKIHSADYSATYDISNNWKKGAIMDILVSDSCPAGYEEALYNTWEGNSAGCWCRDVTSSDRDTYGIKENAYTGHCSTKQLKAGCVDIQENPAVNFTSWGRVDEKRQLICVARSSENFAEDAPEDGVCTGAGVTTCGNSKENAFCTRESQCPISNIKITTLKPPLDEWRISDCKNDLNCRVLDRYGSNVKLLEFTRGNEYDALPLSEFALNEYGMCNSLKKPNFTPDRKNFWLAREARTYCNETGDLLWNKTDTRKESELFEINGLNPIINYLSDFGFYEGTRSGNDYNWNLYSRNYIPFATKCRDRMGTFISRSHGVKSLRFAQLLQLIVACVAGAVLGIVLPILIIFGLKPKLVKKFNYIGKVVQLPFMIITIILAGIIYKFFGSFVENDCSTPAVLAIINSAGAVAKAAYNDNVKAIAGVFAALLYDIGAYFYKKYKESDRKYYPQVNIEQQHIPKGQQQRQGGAEVGVRVNV